MPADDWGRRVLVERADGIEQTATQNDYIDLAGAAIPVLTLGYDLSLVHSNDRAYVEVQVQGQSGWTKVKSFVRADDTTSPSTLSLSLAAWSGNKIRLRFRFAYAATNDIRRFAVQHASVGEAP